jgi:transcriptional regulator with GAF, ATPase, and Fis domain
LRLASVDEIIGADSGLKTVMEMVRQVAPLDSPVMIMGETGVGKEVVANAIHYSSPRAKGPFIKVNCGAIPDGLLDSELFGHQKGAFTGALRQKRGRFERAHMGTIFLDEIGELPPNAQIRLLRVIQHKEIERLGRHSNPMPVDVRIIAATHRNLELMISQGEFPRGPVVPVATCLPIMIPPLRQEAGRHTHSAALFPAQKIQGTQDAHTPADLSRHLEPLGGIQLAGQCARIGKPGGKGADFEPGQFAELPAELRRFRPQRADQRCYG